MNNFDNKNKQISQDIQDENGQKMKHKIKMQLYVYFNKCRNINLCLKHKTNIENIKHKCRKHKT